MTGSRLRRVDLSRPFRGMRSAHAGGETAELVFRCRALVIAAPAGAFLSHLTAATLWPLPVPPRSTRGSALHVSVRHPARAVRRVGVVGHTVHDPSVTVVWRSGLPLVDPASLFCQLAHVLTLPDLVAVGDALIHVPPYRRWGDDRPWLDLDALTLRVTEYRGRGKARAVAALGVLDAGSESRPESILRVTLTRAGLPRPEANGEIRSASGVFMARADLVFRRWRVVVEYDGDQHRTSRQQYVRDVERHAALGECGWTVVRVLADELFSRPRDVAARVEAALRRAGWRP